MVEAKSEPGSRRCWICHSGKHAVQYTYTPLDLNGFPVDYQATPLAAVCWVCPKCDFGPGAVLLPRP